MDNKTGEFIRKLRSDNKMSQNDLAEMIPIDRSVISKWERGEATPPIDKMKILCKIFHVTIDELISGEFKTKENEEEHENNLFDFLLRQDSKYRKLKIFSIILFVTIIVLSFSFLIYYFLETHNTEKIYRIHGSSMNYELNNGLLVITREKSYLKLGFIINKNDNNENIYEVELYYKDKEGNNNIIYNGSSDTILIDRYGYDASLNNLNYEDIKDSLYIKINEEEIELELSDEYFNSNYKLDDWIDYNKDETVNFEKTDVDFDKVSKEFDCDEIICRRKIGNIEISYYIENRFFQLRNEEATIEYQVDSATFIYLDRYMRFRINNSIVTCEVGPCDNYKEIYDKYYTNLIKNYLQ